MSFVDERGSHAGPSEDELNAFILHPPSVRLPAGALTHPRQLYPHFLAYREAAAAGAEPLAARPRRAPPADPASLLAADVPCPAGDGRGAAAAGLRGLADREDRARPARRPARPAAGHRAGGRGRDRARSPGRRPHAAGGGRLVLARRLRSRGAPGRAAAGRGGPAVVARGPPAHPGRAMRRRHSRSRRDHGGARARTRPRRPRSGRAGGGTRGGDRAGRLRGARAGAARRDSPLRAERHRLRPRGARPLRAWGPARPLDRLAGRQGRGDLRADPGHPHLRRPAAAVPDHARGHRRGLGRARRDAGRAGLLRLRAPPAHRLARGAGRAGRRCSTALDALARRVRGRGAAVCSSRGSWPPSRSGRSPAR